MNGYLFAASITTAQLTHRQVAGKPVRDLVQTWSGRDTLLFRAESVEAAQALFDKSMALQSQGENPREIKVHEVMVAQLVGELLTETARVPLDLAEIARQARTDIEATPEDYFEQGYWLDLRQVKLASPTLEALQQGLPEETRSGLNWLPEKQFYYLFSVLSPPVAPTEPLEEPQEEAEPPTIEEPAAAEEPAGEESTEEPTFERFLETDDYPRLVPMETAVMVRARNAAVAAWLWHCYAADTRLAENAIGLEAWNGVGGVEIPEPDANATT